MSRSKFAILLSLTALIFTGCPSQNKPVASSTVNLAIWGNYLSPASQKKFSEQTGLQLNILNYTSNEELLAKIQAGPGSIDVAVPSDYMVDIMIKLNLLESLDRKLLPSFADLLPEVLAQPYDAKNEFSLPYASATSGIAVNRSLYKGEIKSWGDLFNNPKLNGQFALLDDVREVLGAVLKYQGQSLNSTDEKALEKAKTELLAIRKRVKMFSSDTINILKNKEVAAAQVYSPDATQLKRHSNGDIEYILPLEGGARSIDNLVIFKSAPNKENAHRLINFLLSQEVNLEFVKAIGGSPVVKGVREKLPDDLKNNPTIFPSSEALSKLERITDLGEKNALYEKIWTEIKTQ